ncbi:MAG: PepSY domain-containing protein [Pseudomonadota bacterium]
MKHKSLCAVVSAAAFALTGLVAPASASSGQNYYYVSQQKQRDDQGEARKEMKAGNQLSLREIERKVIPQMSGAEYLGPTYDAASHAYRLKFIKNGRVMYVDVDARTGQIINRSR